jgi:outer membrane protein assembly factor BamE (lipoprotein component of BamABCDE complex)
VDNRNGANTSFGEDTKCLALSEMEPVLLGWSALSVCSTPASTCNRKEAVRSGYTREYRKRD